MKGTKFCPYCRRSKPDEGFKSVYHAGSNSSRAQCPACQAMRSRPQAELQILADREREYRKVTLAAANKTDHERKKNEKITDHQ